MANLSPFGPQTVLQGATLMMAAFGLDVGRVRLISCCESPYVEFLTVDANSRAPLQNAFGLKGNSEKPGRFVRAVSFSNVFIVQLVRSCAKIFPAVVGSHPVLMIDRDTDFAWRYANGQVNQRMLICRGIFATGTA